MYTGVVREQSDTDRMANTSHYLAQLKFADCDYALDVDAAKVAAISPL